jgi:hypothetical protein
VKSGADLDRVLGRALAAKLETRRALARLPYEEKFRHWVQMKARTALILEAREADHRERDERATRGFTRRAGDPDAAKDGDGG